MTLSEPNVLTPRRPSRSALKTLEDKLSHISALSTPAFVDTYFPPDWSTWTNPRTTELHTLIAHRSSELSSIHFEACFNLIEQSSGADYRSSSVGWNEKAKKEEMRSDGLWYILIHPPSSSHAADSTGTQPGEILGFVSFMPTLESNRPVLYIYEIHLLPSLRSTGLGSHLLLHIVLPTAQKIQFLEKVMLTCFRRNDKAMRFYTEKMGMQTDEDSPTDRVLRGGRVVTSDYVILSWRIPEGPLGDGEREKGGVTE